MKGHRAGLISSSVRDAPRRIGETKKSTGVLEVPVRQQRVWRAAFSGDPPDQPGGITRRQGSNKRT